MSHVDSTPEPDEPLPTLHSKLHSLAIQEEFILKLQSEKLDRLQKLQDDICGILEQLEWDYTGTDAEVDRVSKRLVDCWGRIREEKEQYVKMEQLVTEEREMRRLMQERERKMQEQHRIVENAGKEENDMLREQLSDFEQELFDLGRRESEERRRQREKVREVEQMVLELEQQHAGVNEKCQPTIPKD